MAYGNYNRGYNNNRSYGNSYNNNGYNRSYRFSYSNNYRRTPRKKSGCKIQMIDGNPIVSAWKVSKGQLITLYARPYKGTKERESKSGKNWMNLFVTILNKTTMQETKTSGMFDLDRKRLILSDFNLICSTNGQGGYFGKHISKR